MESLTERLAQTIKVKKVEKGLRTEMHTWFKVTFTQVPFYKPTSTTLLLQYQLPTEQKATLSKGNQNANFFT